MDKEQLQDILNQVRNLNHMEYDKAERLKKKAARIILGSSYSIEQIRFTSQFGFSSPDYNRQEFYRGKNELESIIEAKMEVLINRDQEIRKQKERLTPVPKTLTAEVENIVKNKDVDNLTEQLRSELFAKKTELTEANNEIQSLKSEIKITKKFRIIKEVATVFLLIAGGFTAGSVVVGIKVDYDKRLLQEKVDNQTYIIKKLSEKK